MWSLLVFGLLVVTESIYGRRTNRYSFSLSNISCTYSAEIVEIDKCLLDQSDTVTFAGHLRKDIDKFNISIRLDMAKEKGSDMFTVFNIENMDGCEFLSKDNKMNFVYLYKKMILDSNKLPTCPLRNGFKINFERLKMDPNRFPYLPDTKFLIKTKFEVEKSGVTIKVTGNIQDLKKRRVSV
ncbi:hypothetical protein ACFFRR_009977 [Megaselia abdita]